MADEARSGSHIAAIVLTGIASAEALGVLALRVVVIPPFIEMFADFGAALPVLTMLVMGWVWPLMWMALILGLVAVATVAPVSMKVRIATLIVAVMAGIVALVATVGALYMPLFAMSGDLS